MKLLWFFIFSIIILQACCEVSIKTAGNSTGNSLEMQKQHIQESENKYFRRNINCKFACAMRCMKSSRKNLCNRACNSCCYECKCVPPGTHGNHYICPCYARLRTHGNRPKCP
ncbi:unnamed protein product [Amaranthus hypochondriacus]